MIKKYEEKSDNAFPSTFVYLNKIDGISKHQVSEGGLSKRELFAAMAMQGFLVGDTTINTHKGLAKEAIKCADALISELEKK